MADDHSSSKKSKIVKMIFFGILSLTLYAVVFINQDEVMRYYTKGHWFAALPVLTVFAFSFIHGAFASYLWSVLGIEAIKK